MVKFELTAQELTPQDLDLLSAFWRGGDRRSVGFRSAPETVQINIARPQPRVYKASRNTQRRIAKQIVMALTKPEESK